MSPKIVNGSFAAIYDTADVFEECTKAFGQLRLEARDSPGINKIQPLLLIRIMTSNSDLKLCVAEFEEYLCQENNSPWIPVWISYR